MRFLMRAGLVLTVALLSTTPSPAADVNTAELGANGWFSDDTRADGTGAQVAGTSLVSDTLTDDPEATASGSPAHDADILNQIAFLDGTVPVPPPGGTWPDAVHLSIAAGAAAGKSQISHRKDDGVGHAAGSVLASGFSAEYSWMGNGTSTVTASLKLGFKTSEFASTGVSTRTGENAWDKLLVYEPGNGNGGTSDGTWRTETISFTSGNWWVVDRTNGVNSMADDMTLEQMSTSSTTIGTRTLQDVYNLLITPGSHLTSVQFGIGSSNAGGSVYVNQLVTSFYRPGDRTTFGGPVPVELMSLSVD